MFLSLSTAQELVCMLFLFLGSTQNNKTKQIASLFKLQVLSLVSFCTVIPVLYVTNGGREWGPLGKPNFSLVYSSHFFFFLRERVWEDWREPLSCRKPPGPPIYFCRRALPLLPPLSRHQHWITYLQINGLRIHKFLESYQVPDDHHFLLFHKSSRTHCVNTTQISQTHKATTIK